VKKPKGQPDIYLKAADKLGLCAEECAVFEDILQGIAGAKAGNFKAIGVYDPASAAQAQEIRALSDHYIESYRELL